MPGRRGRGPEKRRDPNEPSNETTFTKADFIEFYGEKKGEKAWDRAGAKLEKEKEKEKKATEKRADPNETSGKTYTREEFLNHYGKDKGQSLWDKAGKKKDGDEKKGDKKKEKEPKEKREKKDKEKTKEKKEKEPKEPKEPEEPEEPKEPKEPKPKREPRTLVIYTSKLCPYSHRFLWVAAERKVKFEHRAIPTNTELEVAAKHGVDATSFKGVEGTTLESLKKIKEDYKKDVNPSGVGCIRFEGTEKNGPVIDESEIACEFLDALGRRPAQNFVPRGPESAARMRLAIKRMGEKINGPCVELLKNQEPSKDAELQAKISAGLEWFSNSMNEDGPYFFGRNLSLADICLAPFYARFGPSLQKHRGFSIPGLVAGSAEHLWQTRLEHWWKTISEREAFQESQASDEAIAASQAFYAGDRQTA